MARPKAPSPTTSAGAAPSPRVADRPARASAGRAGGWSARTKSVRRPDMYWSRISSTSPRPARSSESPDGRCRERALRHVGTASCRSTRYGRRPRSAAGGTTSRQLTRDTRRNPVRSAMHPGRFPQSDSWPNHFLSTPAGVRPAAMELRSLAEGARRPRGRPRSRSDRHRQGPQPPSCVSRTCAGR